MDCRSFRLLLDQYRLKREFLEGGNSPQSCKGERDESRIACAMYKRFSTVSVPKDDLICLVLQFVISCPQEEWEAGGFPLSACRNRSFKKAGEIFGEDVGEIFTALAMFYGSLDVFNLLRERCVFDSETGTLKSKR